MTGKTGNPNQTSQLGWKNKLMNTALDWQMKEQLRLALALWERRQLEVILDDMKLLLKESSDQKFQQEQDRMRGKKLVYPEREGSLQEHRHEQEQREIERQEAERREKEREEEEREYRKLRKQRTQLQIEEYSKPWWKKWGMKFLGGLIFSVLAHFMPLGSREKPLPPPPQNTTVSQPENPPYNNPGQRYKTPDTRITNLLLVWSGKKQGEEQWAPDYQAPLFYQVEPFVTAAKNQLARNPAKVRADMLKFLLKLKEQNVSSMGKIGDPEVIDQLIVRLEDTF